MFINLRIFAVSVLLFGLLLVGLTVSGSAQTLYTCESPRDGPNPFIHTIDPSTGATLSTTQISLEGEMIEGCNGLAKDPSTGTCWIALSTPDSGGGGSGANGNRLLGTLDEVTGVVTLVGETGERIAGIAFNTNGDTLYGITGDGDGKFVPKIVTLSKIDGSSTFVQNLVNDDEPGEAIGFNPNDELLYRASGTPPVLNVDAIFESINPPNAATPIDISGNTAVYNEQLDFVYQSGNTFLISQRDPNVLHSINTNGVVSFIGDMNHSAKGLAFDCGVPTIPAQVPTLSQWGLITMAGILGFIGFMVIRRRRVAA